MDESNVFFEIMLPRLCDIRREEMASFKGTIVFRVKARLPRTWTLTGGRAPWVKKGGAPKPDAMVRIDEALVKEIVQGKAPDLEAAVKAGRLIITGDMKTLETFERLMDYDTVPNDMYDLKKS